jgi:hypothetical protein
MWCNNRLCTVCFKHGWATKAALNIEARIRTAEEKGYGEPQHIVLTPPRSLWELDFDVLRSMAFKALKARLVTGGCSIDHARRLLRDVRMVGWGPHFHVIGFVGGGYICRDCEHIRYTKRRHPYCVAPFECKGFEQRTRRANEKDDWLCKVEGKRISIFKTALYQLHHASVKLGARKSCVVRWFGFCGTRKFKGKKPVRKRPCVVCEAAGVHNEMVKATLTATAQKHIVKDFSSPLWLPCVAVDLVDVNGEDSIIECDGG